MARCQLLEWGDWCLPDSHAASRALSPRGRRLGGRSRARLSIASNMVPNPPASQLIPSFQGEVRAGKKRN